MEPSLDRRVSFAFPSQGAQYPKALADLYWSDSLFRKRDACAEHLVPMLARDLRRILFPSEEELGSARSELPSSSVIAGPPGTAVYKIPMAMRFTGRLEVGVLAEGASPLSDEGCPMSKIAQWYLPSASASCLVLHGARPPRPS